MTNHMSFLRVYSFQIELKFVRYLIGQEWSNSNNENC